jgi:beta-galactosidase
VYEKLEISPSGLRLGGKDFYLASGDLHYFRIHPNDWEKRLQLAKDFGLTAIQTYVPWHLHEAKRGEFDFEGKIGELNLKAFLELVDSMGLKILFRPAPFICSECDMGGLPSWLIAEKDIGLRCCDEDYLAAVKSYYERLVKEFLPYLSTNGGPIIAIALDNEYGGYGNDRRYLEVLREMLEELGVDVPFYTTDGANDAMLINGSLPDCWHGVNFRSTPKGTELALNMLSELKPDFPLFIGEFWCGRSIVWGESYGPRDPKETADAYRVALNRGAYVNFYMFCGGTNFGFTSGALMGDPFVPSPNKKYPKYLPYTTSYDCDALIGEDGNPTEKYYLCRDVLNEYLGKTKDDTRYPALPTQEINIELTEVAELFENVDALTVKDVDSVSPVNMEALGQNFGYILYTTRIKGANSAAWFDLNDSVFDRATLYVDGEYKGMYMRDDKNEKITFTVPPEGVEVQLLIENIARINNTYNLGEHKGMLKPKLSMPTRNSYYWNQKSMPLSDISALKYKDISKLSAANMPVFLKGEFSAKAGVDTYILTEGFTHGNIWINGFNIGRHWNIGPQKTLYIPGSLLKDTGNVIEIFDTEYNGTQKVIKCVEKHLLCSE